MSLWSSGCMLMQVRLLWQLFQSEREQETRLQAKWQLQELRPPIPVRRSAPPVNPDRPQQGWQGFEPSVFSFLWPNVRLGLNTQDILTIQCYTQSVCIKSCLKSQIFNCNLCLLQVVPLLESQLFQAQESQSQQPLQLSSQACREQNKTTKSGHCATQLTVIITDQPLKGKKLYSTLSLV